jgi:hypothetical protein
VTAAISARVAIWPFYIVEENNILNKNVFQIVVGAFANYI